MSDSTAAVESLPMVTLLYGDDHQALHDKMQALAGLMGDDSMAEMNITHLDGGAQNTREEDVRSAAFTLPFLTSRRMVILTNPAGLMKSDGAREKFVNLLERMPDSTLLILVQDDTWQTGKDQPGWKYLYDYKEKNRQKTHPVLEWARTNRQKARIEICKLPALNAMPGWISNETRRQGGRINPQAAVAMAEVVGNDTGQARQEITKLLLYVDFQRPIEIEDVHELTAPGGQADVFAMGDALALGDGRLALRHLGRLLEEQDAIALFGMIVRQYRLIIMAKEAVENGVTRDDAVGKLLGVGTFPASKAMSQAKLYDHARLNRIYHRLLEIDRQSKTSAVELEVLLQAFIAEMSRD